MKRIASAIAAACLLVAGCGSAAPPQHIRHTQRATVAPAPICLLALIGRGSAGECAPHNLLLAPPTATEHGPTYDDLSNNDPCVCGASMKAAGRVGLIVKANQGTGFIDSTAVPMVQSARAAGLVVGMYDFDQDYSIAEAQTFVARLHAAGILPGSASTFPAFFDVEYGSFSYGGLLAQIRYVQAQGYRVAIYTGAWYWSPHAGCQWPTGISAWLSGYPIASAVCGLAGSLFVSHQFTDSPVDQSVYIGHDFSSYTAALPAKPTIHSKAFRIYPLRRFLIHKLRISERRSIVRWWARGCLSPVHRHVCRVTRHHLIWFADRLAALARHRANGLCINVAGCGASIWQGVPYHWGRRHYRIERAINRHRKARR